MTDSYISLLQQSSPRLIKSIDELNAVQAVVDSLLDLPEMTPIQRDYLNFLGTLIYDYEEKYVVIPELND
jgi:HTH-type transcriptional regulator / antitoxin HigA